MSQNPSFEIPTDFYEDKQTDISKKQSASAATGNSNPRFEEDLNKYPCLGPKQKYPLFDGKAPQQNKETINPLLKPQISDRIFSDLPAELIHIILGYYTHSFKDLIKFSTINKTCQQVSDYSLLWLKVKLMFYPPKEYLRCRGYANFFFRLAFESYEAFVERLIRVYYLPILEKQLFSVEAIFPPVYKVQVVPFQQDVAQYKLYTEESHHEMACRISKWWKDLFIEYQRLYHQYVKYGPYLNYLSARARIFIDVNPNFDYIPIRGTVFVGIVSIYLLFNCNKTNFSVENRIGLYLLLGLLGFYMMLFLIYMLSSLVAGVAYDYNNQTLIFRFEHYYLHGFDLPLLALMGIFVSLLLALLKCDGSLGNNFNWWETVLPLWIGFSLVYGLWCYDHRKNPNLWCLSVSKIPVAYVMLSPPVTCTLIACYYDNIYTGPFQYTLLPLYPIFLLAIIAFGHRLYTICIVVFDLILGRRIVRVFTNKVWLTYLSYFIVLNMTNICTMINCWSVIMLLIDSYRIDDNDWDKRFFTVHFTPLTCFLLFLFSCPYTLLGPFVENRYYELRV